MSLSNYVLNSWKWAPMSQSFFVPPSGWFHSECLHIVLFFFCPKDASFELHTEELVANRTSSGQDSQMPGSSCVWHVWNSSNWHIPLLLTPTLLTFWKLQSWLPSQHGRHSLDPFPTAPHPICCADWHSLHRALEDHLLLLLLHLFLRVLKESSTRLQTETTSSPSLGVPTAPIRVYDTPV